MKILFFTPLATKTGSEKLLWYILKTFDRSKFQAVLYCDKEGPLVKELPADVPFATSAFAGGRVKNMYAKIQNAISGNLHEKHILKIGQQFGADVWYLNTILTATMAKYARKANVKVVFHVHELTSLLESVPYDDLKTTLEIADLVIVTSESVRSMVQCLGVATQKIKVWNPVIDFSEIKVSPERVPQIKSEHQIPADAFVWVMSGSPSYQKGIDIFIEVAKRLQSQNLHFVWLGSFQHKTGFNYLIDCQLKDAQLQNITFLSPSSDNYYDYLNIADAFVLTSREEPFGMVMIEAAYLGKPIAAFDSGGPIEFVQTGMGKVVDDFDIEKLTTAMMSITDGQIATDKNVLRQRAETFDVKNKIAKWQALLGGL